MFLGVCDCNKLFICKIEKYTHIPTNIHTHTYTQKLHAQPFTVVILPTSISPLKIGEYFAIAETCNNVNASVCECVCVRDAACLQLRLPLTFAVLRNFLRNFLFPNVKRARKKHKTWRKTLSKSLFAHLVMLLHKFLLHAYCWPLTKYSSEWKLLRLAEDYQEKIASTCLSVWVCPPAALHRGTHFTQHFGLYFCTFIELSSTEVCCESAIVSWQKLKKFNKKII